MTPASQPAEVLSTPDSAPRRVARPRADADVAAARRFAIEAARLCHDLHCTEILVLDTRAVSPVSDFILIANGTSDRQIRSVGDDVSKLGREQGFARCRGEQDVRTTWLVMDFVDVVVHLFEPATRAHYDLEMMWGDVPRVDWRRPRDPMES